MPRYTATTTREISTETGEVIQQTKTETSTTYTSAEPQYIKLYIKDLMYLSDLPERFSKVLYALLTKASFAGDEGMIVTVNAGIKRLICKDIQAKNPKTISNALTELVKARILKRIETGVYALNPNLFGKGDWSKISKLRLNVDYDLQGFKTFQAAIDYQNREINITPKPDRLPEGKGGGENAESNNSSETGSSNS